jgi:hypothetical protein
MLDRIEQFTNESLLRRMVEKRDSGEPGAAPEVVRDALEAAFQEHQRWLAQWQAQVGELGRVIGTEFESAVMGLHEKAGASEKRRMDDIQHAARAVNELFGQLGRSAQAWEHSATATGDRLAQSFDTAGKLHAAVEQNTRILERVFDRQQQIMEQQVGRESIVGGGQTLQPGMPIGDPHPVSVASLPDTLPPVNMAQDGHSGFWGRFWKR